MKATLAIGWSFEGRAFRVRFVDSGGSAWADYAPATDAYRGPSCFPRRMAKSEPAADAAEFELLTGWLAFHRTTLAEKCADLADADLTRPSAPPSDLTLLGLARHLTIMERVYLCWALGAAPFDLLYCTDDNPDGDLAGLTTDDVTPSMAAWQAEQQRVDGALARVPSLDQVSLDEGRTVRWLLLKVIQEYSRHNGHADLIRERIDGRTRE